MTTAEEITDVALAASKADGCLVLVTETSEATLRWANSTMTTNGHTTARRFSVISVLGESVGVVGAGVTGAAGTDRAEIEAAVRASEEAARQSGTARDRAPLVEPSGPGDTGDDPFDAGAFNDVAAETSIAVFGRFARELAAAFDEGRRDGHLLYGFAEHRLETTWLASSTGLRRRWTQPTGTVEVNGKVAADLTRSAWVGAYTTDFTDLDLPALTGELGRRLGWSARQVELPAGRYETVLPPSAVADLVVNLAASMDGRPAHEGRSAFSAPGGTRVGEQLTGLPLTLSTDPAAPGLETAPFLATTSSGDSLSVFDNGTDLGRVDWLRDGHVHALAYPRAAADELGAAFAAPPDNVLLTGGSAASTDDMVAGTKRGLLLTCLWYVREVDPTSLLLTGLTRDGVYLIEDGAVTAQVNNFRFNESPIDLVRRATEVGVTGRTLCRELKDWYTRTAMPPVRVPDFNMSSVSKAS